MFDYPDQLDIKILESEHPEYSDLKSVWEKIDLLTSGGHRLEKSIAKFLPKRFEEPPEIYKQRIQKFTYRNILGDALKHQVSRLSNGFISVSGFADNSAEADFWQEFRNNTNGKERSEKELVSQLASTLLKFKCAYLQVDRPKALFTPRNQAEEESLGTPYILLHPPMSVINWGGEGETAWVKHRSIDVDTSDPFSGKPKYIATWTYIDSMFVAKYSAAIELNKDGSIKGLAKKEGGEQNNLVPLAEDIITHGLGTLPFFKVELKDEMWSCDQASGKAYEHLRLDCHKFDLLTFAYFQRYYNKQKTPDSNLPRGRSGLIDTYVDEDSTPQVGLEYVPELEAFSFSEPTGAIVEHINNSLERIESEVEQLLDLTGSSTEPGRVQEQSGYAREFDFIAQKESLKSYGSVIIKALRQAYIFVQRYRGNNTPIEVTGLDSFEADDLGKLVSNLTNVGLINFSGLQANLPSTLFLLLYEKLCMLLSSNLSPEQTEQLRSEIQSKTFPEPVQPNASDLLDGSN